ncbi:MAG: hypothetical protein GF346_05075, partial [Candidatus Eisenbacteria bacterium]|nr:hypothetical protein [Candidatus Latescibacterota bacterium]MBD3301798.1 hypothetical protein [Candidatus Eisenbacteria bacterium]
PNPVRAGDPVLLAAPGPPVEGASASIIDAAGRSVRRLAPGGDGRFLWDGRDDAGRRLAAGVYFARIQRPGKGPIGGPILVVR